MLQWAVFAVYLRGRNKRASLWHITHIINEANAQNCRGGYAILCPAPKSLPKSLAVRFKPVIQLMLARVLAADVLVVL